EIADEVRGPVGAAAAEVDPALQLESGAGRDVDPPRPVAAVEVEDVGLAVAVHVAGRVGRPLAAAGDGEEPRRANLAGGGGARGGSLVPARCRPTGAAATGWAFHSRLGSV